MRPRIVFIIFLLLLASSPALAQEITWEPAPIPSAPLINVWTTADGITRARVKLFFNDGGYRVASWGTTETSGNNTSVEIQVERCSGCVVTLAIVEVEKFYELGVLPPGARTFTVKSRGAFVASQQFDTSQIEHWEPVTLGENQTYVAIRTSGGVTFAWPSFSTGDAINRINSWSPVERNGNNFSIDLKLDIWTGAPTRRNGGIQTYSLGPTPPGSYTFTFKVNGAVARVQPFNVTSNGSTFGNPIDDPDFFIRQHYLDFLNREPDSGGLTFWEGQMLGPCGGILSCVNNSRHYQSAAFFQSVEFQQTGYFIYRLQKASYGTRPVFTDFMRDRARVVDGTDLEARKTAFASEWVERAEFLQAYPTTMTPEDFVNKLFDTAQLFPYVAERQRLAQELRSGAKSRAQVLREVIEISEFNTREFNPAFVQMQYFGYLRRDVDEAGYQFWLDVLNNRRPNNYLDMVSAFIHSTEYRARFGQP